MKQDPYHICEYGVIRSLKDYADEVNTLQELYLPENHFNDFYTFITQNQDETSETEKPFTLFSKGKKRQIKVRNYVGVIETRNGLYLEILPKIHTGRASQKEELDETKRIFLNMLKHLKNSPFVNISKAHIDSKKDFPILEVFIQTYIKEAESLFNYGVKSEYILKEENITYLKGKLNVNRNIKANYNNKANFFCEFSEYSNNIPANRLIKTTLLKLLKITRSYSNTYSVNKILSHLEEVDYSFNIQKDLSETNLSNRLFSKYKTLLLWSEIFLMNKSFTNFKGDSLNMAILYPMERIFEDYIAYLFRKYSNGFKIKAQDKSYFLIQEHKGQGRFGLKPDIVIDKESPRTKIVDTKWKLLDQLAEKRNYNISQADIYQLFAYGKKYSFEGKSPSLILLYPSNPNFSTKLDSFIYEGDLVLEVIPFDFNKSEELAIKNILNPA